MHVDRFCGMDLKYTSDFHMARPYGNESGLGWGIGDGTVTGERLNNKVCMTEGAIDPRTATMHLEVYTCESDLV
jgi:hypothetical protein